MLLKDILVYKEGEAKEFEEDKKQETPKYKKSNACSFGNHLL